MLYYTKERGEIELKRYEANTKTRDGRNVLMLDMLPISVGSVPPIPALRFKDILPMEKKSVRPSSESMLPSKLIVDLLNEVNRPNWVGIVPVKLFSLTSKRSAGMK